LTPLYIYKLRSGGAFLFYGGNGNMFIKIYLLKNAKAHSFKPQNKKFPAFEPGKYLIPISISFLLQ
jgi:hypothetical protein